VLPFVSEAWIPGAWQPPVAAFAIAVVASLALVLAGARRLAGLGAAASLVAVLFLELGVRMVTPRMLPERIPWLVLGAGAAGLVSDLLAARGAVAALLGVLTALGGGWFMLGAPRAMPDLARILAEAVPVLAAFAVPLWRLLGARAHASAAGAAAAAAAALLTLGLLAAGSAGAFLGFAGVVAGAALGLLLAGLLPGASAGCSGALALAASLAGVIVSAGLAQRQPAVWAGCAAALLGLAAGRAVAALLGVAANGVVGGLAGVGLAGLPGIAAAFLLRSFA